MKICFVTHNYLPNIDANIRIINNMSKYLLGNGIDISILTECSNGELSREEIIDSHKVYRVKTSFLSKVVRKLMRTFHKEWMYRNRAIEKEVTRLVAENRIDFIIPVNQAKMNVVSVLAASRKDSKIKFIPYSVDPFSTNIDDPIHASLYPQLEVEIYEKCLKAFMTYEMYEENKTNVFKNYLYKMVPLHFPNLQRLKKLSVKDDIDYDKNRINCAYIGHLYSNIRSSKFIFNLFKFCKNHDIIVHIVGGSYGHDPDLEEARQTLGNRLVMHGKVSGQAAVNALINADILINIGNSVTNMLPSKIFEYFSAGKPIINTYKNIDCPSLKYTKKYPLCLDLFERQDITDELVEQFESFCIENKEKIIPYEDIEKLYAEHTIDSVGKRFLEILKEAKGENYNS